MKKLMICILAIFLMVPLAQAETRQISVSQFVEHPALDAVLKGFKDYLKENQIEAEYQVHNA